MINISIGDETSGDDAYTPVGHDANTPVRDDQNTIKHSLLVIGELSYGSQMVVGFFI